ncbi:3889_t:CDS:2 [Diversispora eburnea]|uniref:3889_t:CDS:1 n=1 Tax=Diversispora eburnea TaxID=1213867 RepID=A0A9N8W8J5_9GLOM|nr:3889_t:CDS:2 [Diversispora eburnea]
MASSERGGTIREYIDARKKAGMTWDEFRKLNEGPQFSEAELVKYRQKLDEEREAKLKGSYVGSSSSKKKKKRHRRHKRKEEKRHKDGRSAADEEEEEEHGGDTPVRLSEFLKHGSSSSSEEYDLIDLQRLLKVLKLGRISTLSIVLSF